jgi:uncharacterized DUF497 family protein
MVVTWPSSGIRYPVLVDPSWEQTSNMVVGRWGHAVAAIPSLSSSPTQPSPLLITGGVDNTGAILSSAEIYEPLTQTFTLTSPMTTPRVGHTATPIPGSATGQVLIAGTAGQVLSGTMPEHLAMTSSATSGSTEIYDEVRGTFTAGPAMGTPRFFHTATVLVDGRILLVGGTTDTAAAPTPGADVFTSNPSSPTGGSIAAALGPLNVARFGHTATLLPTGAVLISGGVGSGGSALPSAELFCPINDCSFPLAHDNFYLTGTTMTVPRAFHTATGLANGDVLITGGASSYSLAATFYPTAELFSLGLFQGTSIPMTQARAFHTATLLAPSVVLPYDGGTALGEVLVVGGFDGQSDLASAEAFFPAPQGSAPALASTPSATISHRHAAAALVNDGLSVKAGNGVLVIGGVTGSTTTSSVFADGTPTPVAELFLKTAGESCGADLECQTGHCRDGFCCDTDRCSGCMACSRALTGQPNGTCANVTDDTDPHTACAPTGLSCEPSLCVGGSCAPVLTAGTCAIDKACYASGAVNPANACQACESAQSTTTWTAQAASCALIAPAAASVAPRGRLAFTASGGSNAGYIWALTTDNSGAALTQGGVYTAGTTGDVSDVVTFVDSVGNARSAAVTITSGVSITPASASLAPNGSQVFKASGGSGMGYTWTVTTNNSGGSMTAAGVYTAGAKGGVTDVVTCTDSLGNTKTATVTVKGSQTARGCGCDSSSSGGSGVSLLAAAANWTDLCQTPGCAYAPHLRRFKGPVRTGVEHPSLPEHWPVPASHDPRSSQKRRPRRSAGQCCRGQVHPPLSQPVASKLRCTYDVVVQNLRFEWDAAKAGANRRKHGVTFEEAATAFYDDRGLLIHDPDHSSEEDRFVLLGLSSQLRALVVCHCYRAGGDVIRIISARKADRQERLLYSRRNQP